MKRLWCVGSGRAQGLECQLGGSTSHEANGCIFVNLRNTGNLNRGGRGTAWKKERAKTNLNHLAGFAHDEKNSCERGKC